MDFTGGINKTKSGSINECKQKKKRQKEHEKVRTLSQLMAISLTSLKHKVISGKGLGTGAASKGPGRAFASM